MSGTTGSIGSSGGTSIIPNHLNSECFIADLGGVGYAIGDKLFQVTVFNNTTNPPTVINTVWYNRTTNIILTTAPILSNLRSCNLQIISESYCYRSVTVNTGRAIGDIITYTRLYDVSDMSLAGTIYWNKTTGLALITNLPIVSVDMVPCTKISSKILVLCDDTGPYLYTSNGTYELDGVTLHTIVGTRKGCSINSTDNEIVTLCDDNGAFLRYITFDEVGNVSVQDKTTDGITNYAPVGTVKTCASNDIDNEVIILCDDIGPFLRRYTTVNGVINNVYNISFSTHTNYTPSGTVGICPLYTNQSIVLCDDNGAFLRRYIVIDGILQSIIDTNLAVTAAYITSGIIKECYNDYNYDTFILCDDTGSFLRTKRVDQDGNSVTFNTELDGITNHTITGTIRICPRNRIAAIIANCNEIRKIVFTYGESLLKNGDFEQSRAGYKGPYWDTDYGFDGSIPGPNNGLIFDNRGVDGKKAWYTDISSNLANRVIYWKSIYLENGATYEAGMGLRWGGNAAQMNISFKVNNVAIAGLLGDLPNIWKFVKSVFTFTSPTGYYEVAITSNSTAGNGNDGYFDNITLYKVSPAQPTVLSNVQYKEVINTVIEQVIETISCSDDRRDSILSEISQSSAFKPTKIPNVETHLVNLAPGASWTVANIPTNKILVGLSFQVMASTANFTDADGTLITLLPKGYKMSWESPTIGFLTRPLSIVAAAGTGRVLVTMKVR